MRRADYIRGVHRVAAPHVWPRMPGLVKLPEAWWRTAPVVRVRRLGLELELDLRDNLQRVLYATGTYEPEVLAFEPAPDAAARLRAAAARNRLAVEVVETALGRHVGTAELRGDERYDDADADVRSVFGTGEPVARVPVTTFDAWAVADGLDRLDVVKLDVEGAEADVLAGMESSLRRLRPRALVVELKEPVLERAGSSAEDVRSALRDLGYEPTGDVLPVANELFRPSGPRAGTGLPGTASAAPGT